jgi:hypothetical protein
MDKSLLNWIAEESPWLRFAVETQLFGRPSDASAAVNDPKIQTVVRRVMDPVSGMPALRTGRINYISTGNVFWDLYFLADIGLRTGDVLPPGAVDAFLELQRSDGTFVLQDGTKPGYFCIPTILLSSLAKMGHTADSHILRFIEEIFKTQRLDGGWHCALSRAVGQKLQDSESCPMDNLNVLMLLGQYDRFRKDPRLNGAIDLLLTHWRRRAEPWRPYGFGIGGDFTKLKYPAVKYGILRALDVLSLYPYAVRSPEYREMLALVAGKSAGGKFHAESVSRSYAAFDFGQTKTPSRWITFLVRRLHKRTDDILAE